MPKYTQNEFLRALEGDTPQPDTIIAAGQAVAQVVEPPVPGTGDSSLTPYNRTSVLLQILAMQMPPDDLSAWLTQHAVDLEVYQLAHSAKEIRDTAAALNVPNGNFYPLVASVAADMARNANHSASMALDSADEAKRAATAEIMQTYGDAAVTSLRNALEEIRMAVRDMPNGGDTISHACEFVLNHLGTSSSPSTPVIPEGPMDGPATEGIRERFSQWNDERKLNAAIIDAFTWADVYVTNGLQKGEDHNGDDTYVLKCLKQSKRNSKDIVASAKQGQESELYTFDASGVEDSDEAIRMFKAAGAYATEQMKIAHERKPEKHLLATITTKMTDATHGVATVKIAVPKVEEPA